MKLFLKSVPEIVTKIVKEIVQTVSTHSFAPVAKRNLFCYWIQHMYYVAPSLYNVVDIVCYSTNF